ncbi:hypothetical protein INR49_031483 [Caranx melampygus]|nr:hypothetical protein INR49_031483 [Caranx melampygus]
MTNRDQIRSNYSSLKMDMDNLQKIYDGMRLSKNSLESSYKSLWKEKDQWQSRYNSLWRTNSRLQANYSLLVTDRDALQNKTDQLMEKLRGKPCKSGWIKFDFSCYFISTLKRNWTESRSACKAQGADLVVFINKKLKKGQNIWIGLTDSLMEGKWVWVDGSPVTMQFWQPGQPNSFNGNQDCAELVQTVTTGEWNDDGCFAEQSWICEQYSTNRETSGSSELRSHPI